MHLGERFRTKSAWELHPCRYARANTSCLQSCTVNVLFDPQLNIWLIKRWGETEEKEAGRQTKEGGWEWWKWEEEVGRKMVAKKKRMWGKRSYLKIKRRLWKDGTWYFTFLSTAIFQLLRSLKKMSHIIHRLLDSAVPHCITSFLVPAVHSSVSLLISFSSNIRFFHHIPSLPPFFPPSFLPHILQALVILFNKLFSWITLREALMTVDWSRTQMHGSNIDYFSHCGHVDTENSIHTCR